MELALLILIPQSLGTRAPNIFSDTNADGIYGGDDSHDPWQSHWPLKKAESQGFALQEIRWMNFMLLLAMLSSDMPSPSQPHHPSARMKTLPFGIPAPVSFT